MSEKKRVLPPVVYVLLVGIFISPLLLYQFLGQFLGLFTFAEYKVISMSPINLLFFLFCILSAVFSCLTLHKTVANYKNEPTCIIDTNRKLKILAKFNIISPISIGIIQGAIAWYYASSGKTTFASFGTTSPVVAIFCFSLATVFYFSLEFWKATLNTFHSKEMKSLFLLLRETCLHCSLHLLVFCCFFFL